MKKTLLYLQSLALATTPILTTVSCSKTKKIAKNKLNPTSDLSQQEKEIISNTSLFTKLLLLSRHENLNFNSTAILNAVFAPKNTWNGFSRNYTIDDKTYNLNDYTEKLTTEYSNLAKLSATETDPFLASTLTGMYEDKLYQNYIAQEKNQQHDVFGFFDQNFDRKNVTPIISLSNNSNRKQLAWANFTGPLSKYFADNNTWNYQDDGYVTSDPRQYYGCFLDFVNDNKKPWNTEIIKDENGKDKKINLEGLKVKSQDKNKEINEEFGKFQNRIFNAQKKANFAAQVLEFIPFIQNFNETASGSIYGLKLLNSLCPFTDTKTDMDVPCVLFFLLQMSVTWMRQFAKEYKDLNIEKAINVWNKAKEINGTIDSLPPKPRGLFAETGIDFFKRIIENASYDFKVQMLMEKYGKRIGLFNAIKEFKDLISDWIKEWDKDMKTKFFNFFAGKIKQIQNLASGIKPGIADLIQGGLKTISTPDEVLSFFNVLGDMMSIIATNEEKFMQINNTEGYQNQDFSTLPKNKQQEIANLLGFKKDGFEDNSVLDGLYKVTTNEVFKKLFLNHKSPLYKYNSENVKEIHEQLLQYALDDQYWKIDEKSFKLDGAITGNESLHSKFRYSLEYNGIGDETVTKFLDQPVELPNDFNPIEPWRSPTNVSKNWKADDYIAYTGLGNNYSKKVNFKYNVEWSNVSGNPEFPYWVITKVDMFRKENGTWKQFYPVM